MLAAALQYYGEKGMLDNTPVPIALEREKSEKALNSPLRYPGKLAADLAGNRLFISDSNNHRQDPLPAHQSVTRKISPLSSSLRRSWDEGSRMVCSLNSPYLKVLAWTKRVNSPFCSRLTQCCDESLHDISKSLCDRSV